ncbi:hypothetical protein J2Z37_003268 [Ammoniphilus resinae]|uniref:Uncharacterized protein n=1 Tax=Ammoniphilus resinae TaxID=861532 RepID=A0ABS4GSJ9_9BACL|nr:hypothetical protein [Ammoniphilus resinae]
MALNSVNREGCILTNTLERLVIYRLKKHGFKLVGPILIMEV